MNFIDKFFLWLVMLPASLYRSLGVDIVQLRAILSTKLTMDNRRPASFGGSRRKKEKKEVNGATLKTIFSSLIMGLLMLFAFAVGNGMLTKLSLFMTMFIFMVCLTLITDFTSVLIDIRDNLIILPKPVSDATFMTARLLHIGIRTSIIVLPLSVPALVVATIMQGPLVILPFVLMILLMTLLSIFFINAVYLLILKITTPAKFQNIIGSIQIGFVMIMMLAYQVLPRMVSSSLMQHININEIPFVQFVPSFWFADGCMALSGGGFTLGSMVSLALSIVVPLLSIWVVVRFFAPSFNQKLGMITGGTTEQSTVTTKPDADVRTNRGGKSIWQRLAGWLTKPGLERAGFLFAAQMSTRSRDFKLRVYPAFGSIIIITLIPLIQNNVFSHVNFANPKMVWVFLLVIYLCCMPLGSALFQVAYSDKFKASWVFFVTPLDKPGLLISGTAKFMLLFFVVPLVTVLFLLGTVLLGLASLPNLLLAFLNALTIGSLLSYLMIRKLPFSIALSATQQGNAFIRIMLLLIFPGTVGVIHWLISGFQWAIWFWIILSTIALWLILDEIKKRGWKSLT